MCRFLTELEHNSSPRNAIQWSCRKGCPDKKPTRNCFLIFGSLTGASWSKKFLAQTDPYMCGFFHLVPFPGIIWHSPRKMKKTIIIAMLTINVWDHPRSSHDYPSRNIFHYPRSLVILAHIDHQQTFPYHSCITDNDKCFISSSYAKKNCKYESELPAI